MGVFIRFMGSPNCKDLKNAMGKLIFEVTDSHLFWGFLGHVQGLRKWFVFLNLTLTDRNMQAKFGLKGVLEL